MRDCRRGLDWLLDLLNSYSSQLLVTVRARASTQSTVHCSTHSIFQSAVSSQFLWPRISTADVPFSLGSRTFPTPQPQQISTNPHTTIISSRRRTLDCISLRHWGRLFITGLRSEVMLWTTVSRSLCLGVRHRSGVHDQIIIAVRQFRFVHVGHPLWREDGSHITAAAGCHQSIHSRVPVSQDLLPHS
jgi:hypothetical protein